MKGIASLVTHGLCGSAHPTDSYQPQHRFRREILGVGGCDRGVFVLGHQDVAVL
jgi:hypothetical protein